jgi:hypothetical protein
MVAPVAAPSSTRMMVRFASIDSLAPLELDPFRLGRALDVAGIAEPSGDCLVEQRDVPRRNGADCKLRLPRGPELADHHHIEGGL